MKGLTRSRGVASVDKFTRVGVKLAELVHGLLERPSGLTELDETWLEVAERTLDQARPLLEVREQVVPQRVLQKKEGNGEESVLRPLLVRAKGSDAPC